ncbi:MAG TPA: bacterial transcriptional activator domain-containing protein [Terriglobales bacterium]|nr:bacterial transcriptional activator domain-containing protein [Terriglobales bacterium]
MKRIVLAMLLVAAITAVAQTAQAPAPGAATPPAQKKEIKDPAEYNAYVGAIQQQDPAAKVSGLEAFLTQYPNSVMKEDALELLMGAYQQTGNAAKMQDTATKVLAANPCNLRALALLAFTKRALAEAGQNAAQNLTDAGQYGEKGLQCVQTAPKPEGTSAEEFDKLKKETAGIFNGAAGMAAFSAKDYAKAQQYLGAAVQADPPDANSLRDVYPLALAYLTPPICPPPAPTGADAAQAAPATPPPAGCSDAAKETAGLFYIARATALAQGAGKTQIGKFGQSKYNKFHGGTDGWDDLVAKAGTATTPAGITITQYVPPTPAQQCADLLKSKKVEEMAFAEWQLCLSEGNPPDAEKVWTTLKGKPLVMQAHIISIDAAVKATKLMLAGSEDDIEAKKADIDLTMAAAIPKKDMPKEDTDFQFQATPTSYTAKPFIMTMNEGAMIVKSAPKKTTPVHRKPAQ